MNTSTITPERISFEKGLYLYEHAPLEELRKMASSIRHILHPHNYVTYIPNSNPNYTNICSSKCSFCAFCRNKEDPDSFFKTKEEVLDHFAFADRHGVKQVLLQGGINEKVTLEYLLDLVSAAKEHFPHIHPHFFSAIEIAHAANISNVPLQKALEMLYEKGLKTIPGAGAEILSKRVREKISPRKLSAEKWLELHELAHTIGFKTTATMMFGHIENSEDILIHFDALRTIQDKTHGFLSFIPWSQKPNTKSMGDIYLRLIAFSRIYLDNFPHIGASWFSEGKEVGKKALHYGADDFGGTLLEENVHKACNFINQTSIAEVRQIIEDAGFEPIERDCFYLINDAQHLLSPSFPKSQREVNH